VLQRNFYRGDAAEDALTLMIQPWVETDYQLSPSVQAMLAYWPEYDSNNKTGFEAANSSNESMSAQNVEVAKGWTLTPYIEVQPTRWTRQMPLKPLKTCSSTCT